MLMYGFFPRVEGNTTSITKLDVITQDYDSYVIKNYHHDGTSYTLHNYIYLIKCSLEVIENLKANRE